MIDSHGNLHKHSESGMAYVAILVLVAIMSTLGLAFLHKAATQTSATSVRLAGMQADYLAEAAANHAMWRLLNDPVYTSNARVDHNRDDAEEEYDGDMIRYNDNPELGKRRYVGVRFLNVNIPQGAIILNAHIRFLCHDDDHENTDLTIRGEDIDHALRFDDEEDDISDRSKTAASVIWNDLPNWQKDITYQTPDIASIIQEIVDRPGWSSGNAMAILFQSTNPAGKRRFYAHDKQPNDAPLLYVKYGDADAFVGNIYYMHSLAGGRYGYKIRRNTDTTFATIATVGAVGENVVHQSYVLYVESWYDPNWHYRQKITILPTIADTDLTDFPYLVKITDSDNPLFDHAQGDSDDILFTGSKGVVKLDHEIESYDPGGASKDIHAWVRVPFISSTDNTEIYMYYGNASASSQQNPTGVWDSNYQAVWHLKETPTVDSYAYDSTANNNHGSFVGMNSNDQKNGQIDGCIEFDGNNEMIRVSDSASLDSTNDNGTFELWINWDDATPGGHRIVMTSSNRFTTGARDGYEWASQGSGNHFFYPWGGDDSNYNLGPNPFSNHVWHHLVVTLKHDTREVIIYVDSVPMNFTTENVPTRWTQLASPDDWLWGGNPDRASRYFEGYFDEIRVSDIIRSQDWIESCYRNQDTPEDYQMLEEEEEK